MHPVICSVIVLFREYDVSPYHRVYSYIIDTITKACKLL